MSTTQFNFPTIIKFGAGAVKLIPQLLQEQGCKRPLVVTDRSCSKLPFVKKIMEELDNNNLIPSLYCEFEGNPVKTHVDDGTRASREHGADSIVIVGGGAALDVGKTIALMTNHPGDVFDYEDGKSDGRPVDQSFPFMVAVPTTAGTGSEVGRASVISEDDTKKKRIIFDPKMLPNVVVADPELTFGLPATITAATGFDALTHNIEAYLAKGFHPICDGIALEGVKLVATHLEKAVNEPNNLEARSGMLMASMMGAIAFQKGLGLTHSAAHSLSTVYDTHHGLANALMLKACMIFNRESCPERIEALGLAAGLKSADDFIDWIGSFQNAVGLPTGLKELKIEITDQLLDTAFADPCHPLGPREVSRDDFKKLYEDSM
jgi:alcohol dehydrogenase class IV